MRNIVLCALVLAVTVATAAAQNPLSDSIRSSWNGVKKNIAESAEQMPEANYGFKPVDTVRSFGEILAHVAGANYVLCASAKGEKSPFAEDHFEKAGTTKAAIVKAVADSHAYCDGAYTALADATAGQLVNNPFGPGQAARASQLIGNIGHDNEHYGNLVTYFRIKGMVPPSSKR